MMKKNKKKDEYREIWGTVSYVAMQEIECPFKFSLVRWLTMPFRKKVMKISFPYTLFKKSALKSLGFYKLFKKGGGRR